MRGDGPYGVFSMSTTTTMKWESASRHLGMAVGPMDMITHGFRT
jgi:hypothetical protein